MSCAKELQELKEAFDKFNKAVNRRLECYNKILDYCNKCENALEHYCNKCNDELDKKDEEEWLNGIKRYNRINDKL